MFRNFKHTELLQLQRDNLADFLQDTIGLIDMYADGRGNGDTPTLSIYYAGNRYHSSVILVNMVDTCMLQLASYQSETSIDTTYVPIKNSSPTSACPVWSTTLYL